MNTQTINKQEVLNLIRQLLSENEAERIIKGIKEEKYDLIILTPEDEFMVGRGIGSSYYWHDFTILYPSNIKELKEVANITHIYSYNNFLMHGFWYRAKPKTTPLIIFHTRGDYLNRQSNSKEEVIVVIDEDLMNKILDNQSKL